MVAHEYAATLRPNPRAVAPARREFAGWLSSIGLSSVADDLEVVFSELVANAASAADDPSGRVRVTARYAGGSVTLEVTNAHQAPLRPVPWDLEDGLREGGRGLLIVQALVDELEMGQDGAGRVVARCRKDVTPAR